MEGQHDTPLVSVITIFLDGEPFLGEAVASVFAQTYDHWELLLVDDGSTDGSTARARALAAEHPGRVRYLEHPAHENRGMSASRNLGIKEAAGELIAFIDADDVWTPEKLARQVAILAAHPEVGMVCGAANYWYSWDPAANRPDWVMPTGGAQGRPMAPPNALLRLYPLGEGMAPCPSDLLLRRAPVVKVGGFEEHYRGPHQMYEDQAFLAKMYLETAIYVSPETWLHYRQHGASCVSEVKRAGRYHEVRRYFLDWFRGYLARRPELVDPQVTGALDHARRPYRNGLSLVLYRLRHEQLPRVRRLGGRAVSALQSRRSSGR